MYEREYQFCFDKRIRFLGGRSNFIVRFNFVQLNNVSILYKTKNIRIRRGSERTAFCRINDGNHNMSDGAISGNPQIVNRVTFYI